MVLFESMKLGSMETLIIQKSCTQITLYFEKITKLEVVEYYLQLKHSFKSVRKVHQNQYLEIIFTEITTSSNNRLLICSCYRTPNTDQNWLNNFGHYLNDGCSCYENIILVGDFNMPHISWNSPVNTTGDNEISFLELINDYFLSQLNDDTF